MENNMEVPQKIKHRPYDQGILLLGIYSKEIKSEYHRDIYTSMFNTALCTIPKIWNQLRCPAADE